MGFNLNQLNQKENKHRRSITERFKEEEAEEPKLVTFQVSPSLYKAINKYCAINDLKKKEFLTQLILDKFNKEDFDI